LSYFEVIETLTEDYQVYKMPDVAGGTWAYMKDGVVNEGFTTRDAAEVSALRDKIEEALELLETYENDN
jgi:hypothetical protein